MTDNEIIKAWDILAKLDFFYGQRAGMELWFEKPVDVQDEDIKNFREDITFLKKFISCQMAEIERFADIGKMYSEVRAEVVIEFAERLKEYAPNYVDWYDNHLYTVIDNLVKEMIGEQE